MSNGLNILNFESNRDLLDRTFTSYNRFGLVVCPYNEIIPFQLAVPNELTHYTNNVNSSNLIAKTSLLPDGSTEVDNFYHTSQFLKVTPGFTYTIVLHTTYTDPFNISYYDENKNHIVQDTIPAPAGGIATFTIDALDTDRKFVRIRLASIDQAIINFKLYVEPDPSIYEGLELIDYDKEKGSGTALTATMVFERWEGYDIVIWNNITTIAELSGVVGHYRLVITINAIDYYSEVLGFSDVSDMTKITYYHNNPVKFYGGHITYDNNYQNYFYLDVKTGKPEPVVDKIGETRNGYFFQTGAVTYLLRKIFFYAPEFIVNAIRIIPAHKFIKVKYCNEEYNIDRFDLANVDWEEKGDLADIVFEFSNNTVVSVYTDSGLPALSGDYNNDYSNDYLNFM